MTSSVLLFESTVRTNPSKRTLFEIKITSNIIVMILTTVEVNVIKLTTQFRTIHTNFEFKENLQFSFEQAIHFPIVYSNYQIYIFWWIYHF
jgi:hypothetical protein